MLNILNISIKGNKSELCNSILSLLTNLNELLFKSEGTSLSKSEDEINENRNKSYSSMQADGVEKIFDLEINEMCFGNGSRSKRIYATSNVSTNYSDIENTVSKFNAEPHENVINWIKHFENIAQLFDLSITKFRICGKGSRWNCYIIYKDGTRN
ncbi:hypothetical protein TNIN_420771 [Trichonephila inaurata madagascariensis]|uniref:Uncharacterized protein n=1 Tax=Trichonephila inaurata madagascariensis TaxID=2747483 RepID=A0A8X6X176_9ARAC|nr:hypothetical protein TNIN_420771 [Trichonephila inaurata madagascariensis]